MKTKTKKNKLPIIIITAFIVTATVVGALFHILEALGQVKPQI